MNLTKVTAKKWLSEDTCEIAVKDILNAEPGSKTEEEKVLTRRKPKAIVYLRGGDTVQIEESYENFLERVSLIQARGLANLSLEMAKEDISIT